MVGATPALGPHDSRVVSLNQGRLFFLMLAVTANASRCYMINEGQQGVEGTQPWEGVPPAEMLLGPAELTTQHFVLQQIRLAGNTSLGHKRCRVSASLLRLLGYGGVQQQCGTSACCSDMYVESITSGPCFSDDLGLRFKPSLAVTSTTQLSGVSSSAIGRRAVHLARTTHWFSPHNLAVAAL